jgi:hypothetical protein
MKMRNERRAIAMNVAEQMWETERANDVALATTARLLATALDARISLKAGACIGHNAVEALAEIIGQQTASRRSLLAAHEVLNGIKTVALDENEDFGGLGSKSPRSMQGAQITPLRQVG